MEKEEVEDTNTILILVIMVLVSVLLSMVSLLFSRVPVRPDNFLGVLKMPLFFLLNTFPILCSLLLLFFLTNRVWLSSLLTGGLVLLLTFINYLKTSFRSEPFYFSDLSLVKESVNMRGKYSISLDYRMVLALLCLGLLVFLVFKFANFRLDHYHVRLGGLVVTLLIFVFSLFTVYASPKIYHQKMLGAEDVIISPLEQYQRAGFVYPFLHSAMGEDQEIEDYEEERAASVLADYEYKPIPGDKKVNIIGVMLESFADFSSFEELEFERDPYENWHRLEADSLSGNLLVNVFGGGTINTELSFINGTCLHRDYKKDTNSYLWYFRNEGYDTYGFHPSFGWFYNREETYDYLGDKEYFTLENYFEPRGVDGYMDRNFFDEIIKEFEEKRVEAKPQFSFSVTYQNHGPYPDHYVKDNQFLVADESKDQRLTNVLNNYLAGVWATDQCVGKMADYFEAHEEPVILIFFGDHKPWLEAGDVGYKNYGINMDTKTLEGFLNYYETPFIVHANGAAKEMFQRDFNEDMGIISPHFLMNSIMTYLNLPGDEYNQYLTDLTKRIRANTESLYRIEDKLVKNLNEDDKLRFEEFLEVQRYRLDKFSYESTK